MPKSINSVEETRDALLVPADKLKVNKVPGPDSRYLRVHTSDAKLWEKWKRRQWSQGGEWGSSSGRVENGTGGGSVGIKRNQGPDLPNRPSAPRLPPQARWWGGGWPWKTKYVQHALDSTHPQQLGAMIPRHQMTGNWLPSLLLQRDRENKRVPALWWDVLPLVVLGGLSCCNICFKVGVRNLS